MLSKEFFKKRGKFLHKKADKEDNRHRSSASNIKADTAERRENTAHATTRWNDERSRWKEIKFENSGWNRFLVCLEATHAALMMIRLKWRKNVCFGVSPYPPPLFLILRRCLNDISSHLRLRCHNFSPEGKSLRGKFLQSSFCFYDQFSYAQQSPCFSVTYSTW